MRRRRRKAKTVQVGDEKKVYGTRYSQAVTHPSTNRARRCLTSVIGREPVLSTWYGRRRCRAAKVASHTDRIGVCRSFHESRHRVNNQPIQHLSSFLPPHSALGSLLVRNHSHQVAVVSYYTLQTDVFYCNRCASPPDQSACMQTCHAIKSANLYSYVFDKVT